MKKYAQFILFLIPMLSFSQDPITLFQQFNGSFDFASFGNTLNSQENGPGGPCSTLSSSSASFSLDSDQTLAAAYLYWAGSGPGDFNVNFNGSPIAPDRTFSLTAVGGLPFFSGFADVTSIVASNTDGDYTFSEFEIDVTDYCTSGVNFGGWSVLVIFEDPDLTNERQVSIFDGFEFVDATSVLNITLNFLSIIDENDARLQFLAWEGDVGIALSETVQINGNVLSELPLNPANNAFNGTNSYTGSDELYNMDIDVYAIDDYISAGDVSANIALTSGQDFVIVNNVVGVYNSEVDLDAIIEINDVASCGERSIIVDYTSSNIGVIGLLSPNTPIAFYANNVLVGQAVTGVHLASGESETGIISLVIPPAIPIDFVLTAVIDDIGTGVGIIIETDETNNEFSTPVTLQGQAVSIAYTICDNLDENDGFGRFDLTSRENELLGGQNPALFDISFFHSFDEAVNNINRIAQPQSYENIQNPETIFARVGNNALNCFDVVEVVLAVLLLPEASIESEYRLCVDANGEPIPEVFGELSPPIIDTGLDLNNYSFAWTVDGNPLPDDLNIGLPETDPLTVVSQGGVYQVTITDRQNGCDRILSTLVTVSSPPIVFSAEVISDAFAGTHSIEATASGLGVYEFQLDVGVFQDNGLFTNVSPGTHTITIRDINGCGQVFVVVEVIDYPRFVTPNQDGFHDTWNIESIGNLDPLAKIYIFDRFGKLLKEISPLGNGWNGTYNGNPLPSSDYWFLIEYQEDAVRKEFRGHFTLKR